MLSKDKLDAKTLYTLERLMSDPLLAGHFLVGGTALALQGDPRTSKDIDMFTRDPIDVDALHNHLVEKYGFVERFRAKNTLKGDIDGIDTDMITFNYPLVEPLETDGNLRVLSLSDLAAMKLNAIAKSGDRMKDFFDVAFLSTKFSLNRMLDIYRKKYGANPMPALMGLTYYDDIDFSDTVNSTNGRFRWNLVEKRLREMVDNPSTVFRSFEMEKGSGPSGGMGGR